MKNEVKKVLYLSYTGMTDPLGQSQVLAYLKRLSQTGRYQFTIISFEKQKAYNLLRPVIEELCKDAGISWYPLSYTAKPPVLSTFRDVGRMKKLAKRLAKENLFSIVHCRSYIPSLVGLQLKKKLGIPFLFDMRGFWADERIDGGIWKKDHLLFRIIYNYFKRKERQFLLNADQVVSLTQNAKDEILSWKLDQVKAVSITVIPCCVDMELFDPKNVSLDEQQKARLELNIPADVPVISYVGSLGTWYLLDEMMAFVKTYQQIFKSSIFLVLTGEPEQMVLDAAINSGMNTASLRVKKIPRNEMPLYISLSTLSLFFIKPAFSKKASSPVKQGELMAMGIPIVCNNAVGDTEEIVKKYKAGIVIKEFSQQVYKDAIDTTRKTFFDKQQIIQGAKDFFSLDRGVQLYKQLYQRIENE